MDIEINSKIYLIETDAAFFEQNSLYNKLKNTEVYPVLFLNENESIDASIILARMWDVDDFSFGVFLPSKVVKAIVIHLAKYGLKSKFKNIDYEVFCNSYDLTNLEPVLRGLILKHIVYSFSQDDVLDKLSGNYKLTEIDLIILRKLNPP